MKNQTNKCQCISCKKGLLSGHNITSKETQFMTNEEVRALIISRQ